jgi:hypothetical protein
MGFRTPGLNNDAHATNFQTFGRTNPKFRCRRYGHLDRLLNAAMARRNAILAGRIAREKNALPEWKYQRLQVLDTAQSPFVDRIAQLTPQLITFNGTSFDLPVLRYRAMVHGIAAPGLSSRPYFNRYTEDAIDLCDVLSSFTAQGKVTLHELCRAMGLPGKPSGISGEEVEK